LVFIFFSVYITTQQPGPGGGARNGFGSSPLYDGSNGSVLGWSMCSWSVLIAF
jgi:hypothetical protein